MKMFVFWAAAPMVMLAASTAAAQQCPRPECAQCGGNGYGYGYTDSCEAAYIENVMWPQQYIRPARRGICQSTELMIANGWRRQNLLSKYHFEKDGAQLSEAGRLKVEWILTQAPAQRRTIYVQRTTDQELAAGRVAAVQELASTVSPGASNADIHETQLQDEGHPAGSIDAVFTGFRTHQMLPVLPPDRAGNSSSSSSSGQ
jgi:hypothetical protein